MQALMNIISMKASDSFLVQRIEMLIPHPPLALLLIYYIIYSMYPLTLTHRDITDKSRKYLSVHIVALNQTFSIFWTFTGYLAALNPNFECNEPSF